MPINNTMKAINREPHKNYYDRLENLVAKIDNKPPPFDPSIYYKPRKLNYDADRIREIDQQNMELLKKLNAINRMGSGIDCWQRQIKYKSNLENQELKNQGIAKRNEKLALRISSVTSGYSAAAFIKDWQRMKSKVVHHSRASNDKTNQLLKPYIKFEYCIVRSPSLLKDLNGSIRTRCFFEVELLETKQILGKIVFELYDDVVPWTCANFIEFCKGTNGMTYKGTPFHRIVIGSWCQGGDVTKHNGTGGVSIYGDSFKPENFYLKHATIGVLSMCSNNKEEYDSKFNLTLKALPSMDGKRVVFGRAISGISNIYKIEEFGTKTGKPIKTVIISNCGILPKGHTKVK